MPKIERQYEMHITGTGSLTEMLKDLREILDTLEKQTPEKLDAELPFKWEKPALFIEIY